jgi:hypothetical protein
MKVEDIFYSDAIQTTSGQDQPLAPRKKMEMFRKFRYVTRNIFSYISGRVKYPNANVTSFWASSTVTALRAYLFSTSRACVTEIEKERQRAACKEHAQSERVPGER